MAVPKKRKSPSRRDMRRANHDRRTAPVVSACANCGEPRLQHRVCSACGYYRGKEVVAIARD